MTAKAESAAPDSGSSWASDELEAVAKCPVCGSAERATLHEGLEDRFFGTRGRWTLARCLRCTAGYLDPRPSSASIGRAYQSYYTHDAPVGPQPSASALVHLWRVLRNGYLNSTLGYQLRPASPLGRLVVARFPVWRRHGRRLVSDLPYRGKEGRLLEVGCGNGRLLDLMRWAGWQVEGVEPDASAAALARERGLTVHAGTLEEVELAPHSFDAITMEHVLEHLPAPVETLERCRLLLRPGGLLWVATPNLESPGHSRYGPDWIGLEAPRHLVLHSATSLRWALEEAGFEVELLQPPRVGWMVKRSEELRANRLDIKPGGVRRAQLALYAIRQNSRALRDPTLGEELVGMASEAQT